LGLIGLLAVLPGCPLAPDSDNGHEKPTRLTYPRNTPEDTIRRQGQIWEQQRLPEYEEILHDQFEFYVLDLDANDYPWIVDGFWGRTDEIDMAKNMFDDNFSGAEQPVESISFQYDILGQRTTTDGDGNPIVEITANAVVTVLVGPSDGWISDTRFIFDVIEDPDEPGLYQIKRQQEVEKI
jgi:hypothetical protein